MDLTPHIEKFRRRYAEVETALSDPKVFDNQQRAQELSREYARLKELVALGDVYLKTLADLEQNHALLKSEPAESELALMAREEISPAGSGREKTLAARSSSAWCRQTRPTRATPSSKSAPARAARNPRFSPPTFTGCIAVTPRRAAGRSRRLIPIRPTSAASRKLFSRSAARTFTNGSNTRVVCIASSACRRPRPRGASTPAPAPSPCCLKRRKWTSRSNPKTSRSTSAARPAKAAKA